MTDPVSPPVRRILIALDASSDHVAAIEDAVEMAAAFGAELRGLFVEETRLRELAEHPVTSELVLQTATVEAWDAAKLTLQLRALATRARDLLRRLSEERKVPWSFGVTRGEIVSAVGDAAIAGDLITVSAKGRIAQQESQPAAILAIHEQGTGMTLLHRQAGTATLPLVVFFDGSPASYISLEVAANLLRHRDSGLRVLHRSSRGAGEDLKEGLSGWLSAAGLRATVQAMPGAGAGAVAQILRIFRNHLLILPDHLEGLEAELRSTLGASAASVLIVSSQRGTSSTDPRIAANAW